MGREAKLRKLRKQFKVEGREVANRNNETLSTVAKGIMHMAKKTDDKGIKEVADAVSYFYRKGLK